jgi:hypothetical protein
MTPFWAVYDRHPEMQCKTLTARCFESETEVDALLERLEETHWVLQETLLEAQEKQTMYASTKEIRFDVGDIIWLSTRHFGTTTSSKKLDYK